MRTLKTWGGRSSFSYEGSVKTGTQIFFGTNSTITLSENDYEKMLTHFKEMRVPCGTSRDKPPMGSLGEWLQENITKTAIASYVGPVLVNEGYAEKDGSWLKFY